MKKTLLALAIAGAAVSAHADVKISGHVNYVIGDLEEFNTDAGGNIDPDFEDLTVDDATTTQSRFRILADTEANGITYGIAQEFGLNNGAIGIRKNEFYMKGDFGKVSLGQGSESGDGANENDYSGTYVTTGDMGSWNLNGDFTFETMDPSRTERLKYDTPKLGGLVTLSADYQSDDDVTVAANLGGDFWKASAYFESRGAEGNDSDEMGGSVAVKFAGFTAALQYGDRDESASGANNDREYTSVILGYRSGPHSVAVDFQTNENDAGSDDKETTGLSYVYRPTKGVELYGGWREVDNKAANRDASGFLLGGRVKF